METKYRAVTTIAEVQEYLGDHKIVAFDIETAPDPAFHSEDRAALDPAKSHVALCLSR